MSQNIPPKPSDAKQSVEPAWVPVLERIATGIERLAEEPVIQMETTIPVCPHCNAKDPVVMVKESEGAGKLGEIVFQVKCSRCQESFIIIPFQSFYARSLEEAMEFQQERKTYYERAEADES